MRHWRKPTLIAFSHRSALPIYTAAPAGTGDFIIGNRRQFFQLLVRTLETLGVFPAFLDAFLEIGQIAKILKTRCSCRTRSRRRRSPAAT